LKVDLSLKLAWVHPDQAKARKAIAVPLNDMAIEIVSHQVGKHPVHVFTYEGQPVKQVSTRAWYALKRAGIENLSQNVTLVLGLHSALVVARGGIEPLNHRHADFQAVIAGSRGLFINYLQRLPAPSPGSPWHIPGTPNLSSTHPWHSGTARARPTAI
jgi:hypothetical protein